MVRTVMIAIDGSTNSQQAFDMYVNTMRYEDDKVLLAHVQNTPQLNTFSISQPLSVPTEQWMSLIQEELKKSQKVMEHYEMSCEQKKINKQPLIGSGKPGEVIVEMAKQHKPNMIIVGSHGLNAVRRTFMGSVSEYIINHSKVPVLVVPSCENQKEK